MSYRRDPEFSAGAGAIAAVDGVSNVRRRIAAARARNTLVREQQMARVRRAMGAMPPSSGTKPTYTAPSYPSPIGPPARSVSVRGSIRGALVPMGPRRLPPPILPSAGGLTGPGPVVYPGTGMPTVPTAPPLPGTPPPLPTPTPVVPTTPDGGSSGGGGSISGGGGGGGGAGITSGGPSSAAPPDASTPDDGSDLPDLPAPASSPTLVDRIKENWVLIALGVGAFALWRRGRD